MPSEIKLNVDSYFTETRLISCTNIKCRFNKNYECGLKKIEISFEDNCLQFEIKKEDINAYNQSRTME